MLKIIKTYVIRLLIAIPFLFIIWLAGYNAGSNTGVERATKAEQESCERQIKNIMENKK